jgi:hypothetical protein
MRRNEKQFPAERKAKEGIFEVEQKVPGLEMEKAAKGRPACLC